MKCKHCDSEQTVKAGKNGSGSQRYRCKGCGRHFTPNPNAIVYPPAIRQEAVAMDVDGHGYRRTGRNVRVNHQSVATWVKAAEGKSQTYSVEGGNADLRHYLARLTQKSRCFSRCPEALKRNLALFVRCWNRRQLYKRAHPLYNPPLRDFASIWV